MTDTETNHYKIRGKERYNLELKMTMSDERYNAYLAEMRAAFDEPTWDFARLAPRVFRDWYAYRMSLNAIARGGTLPTPQSPQAPPEVE